MVKKGLISQILRFLGAVDWSAAPATPSRGRGGSGLAPAQGREHERADDQCDSAHLGRAEALAQEQRRAGDGDQGLQVEDQRADRGAGRLERGEWSQPSPPADDKPSLRRFGLVWAISS